MPNQAPIEKSTWILVAERSHATVFSSRGPDQPLQTVMEFDHPRGRLQSNAIDTDRPGRSFDRAGHGRHALSSEESAREHAEHEFVLELADVLDKQRCAGAYDHLILIAGPKFLGKLREALAEPVRRLVGAELNKELRHPTEKELREHLGHLARI